MVMLDILDMHDLELSRLPGIVLVERGEAVLTALSNPGLKGMARAWLAYASAGALPTLSELDRWVPDRLRDHVMVLEQLPDGDHRYLRYGQSLSRLTAFDMAGAVQSSLPGPVSRSFSTIYSAAGQERSAIYTIHRSSRSAFVSSWQRLILPCRIGASQPAVYVLSVPLEYRIDIVSSFFHVAEELLSIWAPIKDEDGATADFACVFANDALRDLLATPVHEWTNVRLARDLVGVAATPLLPAFFRVADGAGPVTLEFDWPNPTGSFRTLRATIVPADDCLVMSAVDLTETRQQQRSLDRATRYARLLTAAIDQTPVSVTISDATQPDLPLTFVNAAFLRTTGYAQEEVLGRNCRFLQGIGTDPETRTALHDAIARGEPHRCTIVNYRKDGTPFRNRLNVAPVHDDNGKVLAYVGMQDDVTDLERSRELDDDRNRTEALGRLTAGIAHEINNMLQPMVALPDEIKDRLAEVELPPDISTDVYDCLDLIQDCGRSARDILRGFLAFARRDPSDATSVDVEATVTHALDLVVNLQRPGVDIIRQGLLADRTAAGMAVIGRGQVVQVLTNLISNAAHASGGAGRVEVGLKPAEDGGRSVILWVRDFGRGMDEATRRRIFEPFFTTKDLGEGTGLGLTVVYGIVRSWKGSISVESRPGRGTLFQITIPLDSDHGDD